jgi:dUTP pyrophosphatase
MKMKIKLDEGAMITTAHETDAGYDLYSRTTKVIHPRGSATFDTGIHVELPNGTMGLLFSKSSLNVKHGITSEGIIDEGYTGSICAKLYNNTDDIYVVNEGDKITQLIVVPIMKPEIEVVEELSETARGNNGFGSSGK